MSTWHQSKNPAGLRALWQPHPTQWKCVSDKPNQFASSISFPTEEEARKYAEKTGDVVIPPTNSVRVCGDRGDALCN